MTAFRVVMLRQASPLPGLQAGEHSSRTDIGGLTEVAQVLGCSGHHQWLLRTDTGSPVLAADLRTSDVVA